MSITKAQINVAGLFSITNAVVTIFAFGLFIRLQFGQTTGVSNQLLLTLNFVILVAFIYAFLSLLKLLNYLNFNKFDIYISALIANKIFLHFIFSLLLYNHPGYLVNLFILIIWAFSICYIVVAIKLLRFSENFPGLIKAFTYTSIASSLCWSSIILAPLGLLIDVASNVILGIIFFRAVEQT